MNRDTRALVVTREVGDMVAFAAHVSGMTESQVVAFAVRRLRDDKTTAEAREVWDEIPVHGTYRDQRITATFVPASRRVTLTSGPLAGQTFKSPSGASSAAVAALNAGRINTQTNGWRFWHVTATGERLNLYR